MTGDVMEEHYIFTTHVGSFPLNYSSEAVVRVITDLDKVGIDFLGYPQLRDFVEMYLESLVEVEAISKTKVGFKVSSWETLKSGVSEKALRVKEAEILKKMYDRKVINPLALKGSVTGPFTLASRIYTSERHDLSSSLLSDKSVVSETLANLVESYVKGLEELNYGMVIIDEPILSVIVGRKILFGYKEEDIIQIINDVLNGVKIKYRGIHVCGRLSPLLTKMLLKLDLEVLDHEHKDVPENLSAYSYKDLKSNEKFLGLGVVSSKSPRVESVEEIKKLIRTGVDTFKDRLLLVKPDCGFRGLKTPGREEEMYKISLDKLRNIVSALRELELSHV